MRPHSLRVAFITGVREAGVPLEDMLGAVGTPTLARLAATTESAIRSTGYASYAVTEWLAENDQPEG